MTNDTNRNDDPATEGRAVPPYEGRTTSGEVGPAEDSVKGGVKTGGATGPVESDDRVDDPASTPRGEHASPADEQPAEEARETDTDPDMTGPSHHAGTRRAEDQT